MGTSERDGLLGSARRLFNGGKAIQRGETRFLVYVHHHQPRRACGYRYGSVGTQLPPGPDLLRVHCAAFDPDAGISLS